MNVIINQQATTLPAHATVQDALATLAARPPFAVAVNTRFVPNTQYASHNAWKRVAPKKPWLNGLYIDYIWTSQGIRVPEWETVVNVDSNGNFVGVIPSDHNMLRATTVIG